MAMNKKVPERIARDGAKAPAEFKQRLDVMPLRRRQARRGVQHVVEAKRQPLVRTVGGEIRRLRIVRIEDGKDVRHLGILERAKLVQAADGQAARGRAFDWIKHKAPLNRLNGVGGRKKHASCARHCRASAQPKTANLAASDMISGGASDR